ncbi:hypothetical protein K466DRAFT_571005 [Polyporus arcularius HHB13444]|uniref:Uncharacterized protein n=1 Tax=Polyporus arcularius HHB13444 TaxID=1314778 RepID=A0A5C3NLS7_9APHY|nr:hypothetical protein K466DRAFT_571005 [Polyporus arcularius HHB13444]
MSYTGLNPACIEVYLGFPERHRVARSGKATYNQVLSILSQYTTRDTFQYIFAILKASLLISSGDVGQYREEGTVDRALSNKPTNVLNGAELKEWTSVLLVVKTPCHFASSPHILAISCPFSSHSVMSESWMPHGSDRAIRSLIHWTKETGSVVLPGIVIG